MSLLTGTTGGYDIDLCRFAMSGMTLLGRLHDIRGGTALLGNDLYENLLAGENWWKQFKAMLDKHAEAVGMESAVAGGDVDDLPIPSVSPTELDLESAGIKSVVWATGYQYDFSWVKLPIFNEVGQPLHRRGITNIPGLYFLGLRRMHTIKSALLSESGVGADARHLAEQITNE